MGVARAHLADAEPTVKAQMLRELAAWYRAFAARAGNPVIWESRLLTAEDLEAEASRMDPTRLPANKALGQRGMDELPR